MSDIRMYSYRQAAEEMGLTFRRVKDLVDGGFIGTVDIGERRMIAHHEIRRFQDECSKRRPARDAIERLLRNL